MIIGATKSEVIASTESSSSNYILAPKVSTSDKDIAAVTKNTEKKKRSIDELKEEIQREQQEKELQQKVKNLLEEQFQETNITEIEGPLTKIHIIIPQDAKTAASIHQTALWVAREGIDFQQSLLSSLNEKGSLYHSWKDRFPFLNPFHSLHSYYRWCVYYLLQHMHHSGTLIFPQELQMVEGGPIWQLPPSFSSHSYLLDLKKLLEEKDKKIPHSLHQNWISLIHDLSLQRQSIKHAMLFALQHAQYSNNVISRSYTQIF